MTSVPFACSPVKLVLHDIVRPKYPNASMVVLVVLYIELASTETKSTAALDAPGYILDADVANQKSIKPAVVLNPQLQQLRFSQLL